MIDITRAMIDKVLRVDFTLSAIVTIAKMIRKKAKKVKMKPIGSVQAKTANISPKTRIIIGRTMLTKVLFLTSLDL